MTGTITLTTAIGISKNLTINGGGLITLSGGSVNQVLSVSAGISLSLANLTVANGAGGIFNQGTLTVTNSTFSGNSAEFGNAGGIFVTSSGSLVTFRNTIAANNGVNCGGDIPIIDGGHNLDSDGSCGFSATTGSLSGIDPLLAPDS